MLIKHQALKFRLQPLQGGVDMFRLAEHLQQGRDHSAAVLGEGASGKKVQAWLAQYMMTV